MAGEAMVAGAAFGPIGMAAGAALDYAIADAQTPPPGANATSGFVTVGGSSPVYNKPMDTKTVLVIGGVLLAVVVLWKKLK